MNQKSSLREVPQFVSGVLTANSEKQLRAAATDIRDDARDKVRSIIYPCGPVQSGAPTFSTTCFSRNFHCDGSWFPEVIPKPYYQNFSKI
jgi:hypothetical protein